MFFISDTHFHHAKIIQLANRPFSSIEEMNEKLIENWNSVVTPKDTVWHLGDFAFGTWKGGDPKAIFDRLNGHKFLIKGNHDDHVVFNPNFGWEGIHLIKTIKHNKHKIVICHYPMMEWDGCFHGTYHFHGHTHNVSPLEILDSHVDGANPPEYNKSHDLPSRFARYHKNWRNVSVEMINYTPIHIDELLKE